MSEFEFSTVLISIVLAIVISEILATLGRMIRLRRQVRPYWVHLGWMGLVLLLAIQFWWALWEIRDWPDWTFVDYVVTLIPFMTLVVLGFLVCPDLAPPAFNRLEDYYYEHSGWIFGLASVFLVQLIVYNPLYRDEPWIGGANVVRVAALGVIVPLALTKNRRAHEGVLAASYVLFAIFVLIDSLRLPG